MPKIAVVGKGGVGKTTLISLLAYVYSERGSQVYVVDADPGASLALALGFPEELSSQIVPIVEMEDLILERTGARPGEYGGYFNLTPRVDDIPESFSAVHRGIHLLVMGSVKGPGAGCVCPENAMLKSLMSHLLLSQREVVLLDMVAGLEHLGRGTAAAVDVMIVVVEPGRRSIDIALQIIELAKGLNIPRIQLVANKVREEERDLALIGKEMGEQPLLGYLPFSLQAIEADMSGRALYDLSPEMAQKAREIVDKLNEVMPSATDIH